MTAAEFKRKWSRFQGKESSAYQEHFNDLYRLLGQPTPAEAAIAAAAVWTARHRISTLPDFQEN